jgi:hypothetical protein
LIKIKEEQNRELIQEISRRSYDSDKGDLKESRYLVYFRLEKELPLIGSEK